MTTALTRERAYRVFLLLNFTRWFPVGFVVGIFILLQTNRGLSIAQAMTAVAVSGFVCFALELPTSGFADAFGRRAVYVAAAGINVVTGLAYLFAQSFWQFVGAAALMGAFRALDSGPLEAWFVDTVHESAPGADVDQELSRQGTVLGVGMAVGALLSGALIWWHPIKAFPAIDLAVAVFAALNVIHLIATLSLLKEAPRPVSSGDRERRALASVKEAPAVITASLLYTTNSMIQAVGKVYVPVINMIVGTVVRIGVVYVLCGIPEINAMGSAVGTFVSYLVMIILNLIALHRMLPEIPSVVRMGIRPLLASVIMGAVSYPVYLLLTRFMSEKFAIIPVILLAILVYLVAAVFTKAITREEIVQLPKGEKLADKLHLK